MRTTPMFDGDIIGRHQTPFSDIMDIQMAMSPFMYDVIYARVLLQYRTSPYLQLFLDQEEIEYGDDHGFYSTKLFRYPYGYLAAIFRWQAYRECRFTASTPFTFDGIERFFEHEAESIYDQKYPDSIVDNLCLDLDRDFLYQVSLDNLNICTLWYRFVVDELFRNNDLVRTLGRIMFPRNEADEELAAVNSILAAKQLKEKYFKIPWSDPSLEQFEE